MLKSAPICQKIPTKKIKTVKFHHLATIHQRPATNLPRAAFHIRCSAFGVEFTLSLPKGYSIFSSAFVPLQLFKYFEIGASISPGKLDV